MNPFYVFFLPCKGIYLLANVDTLHLSSLQDFQPAMRCYKDLNLISVILHFQ